MNTILRIVSILVLGIVLAFLIAIQPAMAAVNCSDPGVICKGGTLSGSEVWTSDNIYVITGTDLIVPGGYTLTLQAGTIVKLDGSALDLVIRGSLLVDGETNNPVYITSVHDDTLGGDTNHSPTTPAGGDWGSVYLLAGTRGQFTHVEMRYGGYSGIPGGGMLFLDSEVTAEINASRFLNSGDCAISSHPASSPKLTNMSPDAFIGNPNNAICMRSASLSTTVRWEETEVAYVLIDDITVASGYTLTLGAGTVIKPRVPSTELFIFGNLITEGTATQPVIITSINDDSAGGNTNQVDSTPNGNDWGRVYFQTGSRGRLDFIELRYGGYMGGMLYTSIQTDVVINQALFQESGSCAISSDPNDSPILMNMTPADFTGSEYNGICIRSGNLSQSSVWEEAEAPYVLINDILVSQGFTLTLGAGIVIKPQTSNVEIIVDGALDANGTETDPVYITSIRDDSVGGNTNNDMADPEPGAWGRVYLRSGSLANLRNVELRYGGYIGGVSGGMLYNDPETEVLIEASVFKNSSACAISSNASYSPSLVNMTPADFSGSLYNGICLRGGNLSINSTWAETEAAYIPLEDIIVTAGYSLTLGPGVVIKPRGNLVDLQIDGTLLAQGTEDNPVTFTSIKDDNVGGDTNNDASTAAGNDWGQVHFRSGSKGELKQTHLSYGGYLSGGLISTDPQTVVVIETSNLTSSGFCAISSDPNSSPHLVNMNYGSFSGSVINGICMRPGNITTNSSWEETEVVYVPLDDITLTNGYTLTVGAGVVIKPYARTSELFVAGTLIALGNESAPVFITSMNDDTVGGSTNNNDHLPLPGDWPRIVFRSGSQGILRYVNLQYGGNENTDYAAVEVEEANVRLEYCRLWNNFRGLSNFGPSAVVSLSYCSIYNNLEYGVFNARSETWVAAENNWWGSYRGPSDLSPPGTDGSYNEGAGDRVSDYVDYDPWLIDYGKLVFLPLLSNE